MAVDSRFLIRTKLEPPKLAARLMVRERLFASLDDGLERRLTLISAPAGYGKSTLVAQWLERHSSPRAAWLSLDRQDNDLERFARYVVAALRQVVPDRLRETESKLSAPYLPTPQSLAESIILEVTAIDQSAVLVLDDYGLIRSDAVHQFVSALVQGLPPILSMVITSRIDPPFPIMLWKSRHWLQDLRTADLRLSREETAAFLEVSGAARLSDGAVETIRRKTEGWIAGLQLAALSLAEAEDPEDKVRAFSGSDRLIVDYLIQEVIASQPAEVRGFLVLTAPLERFCAPLCDRLLEGRPEVGTSRDLIDRLYRANMFLLPLGELHGWYRYHSLFRELLLDRFSDPASMAMRTESCRRAGEWFAAEGWLEEGILYLIAAGDLDAAADVVAANLHEVLNRDFSRRTLAQWTAMFPAGSENGRLPLIVASLYLKVLTFDVESMLRSIEGVEHSRLDNDPLRVRWWRDLGADLAALRSFALFWGGKPSEAHESAAQAMNATSDPRGFQYTLAIQYLIVGLALSDRRSEAFLVIDGAVATGSASGRPHLGNALMTAAFVHLYAGELESCRVTALESLSAIQRGGSPKYFSAHAHLALGSVDYERNLLDEAEMHFREVAGMRYDVNRMVSHEALLGLAHVEMARGHLAAARRLAQEARACANEAGGPLLHRNSEAFDRRLDLTSGNPRVPFGRPSATADFMSLSLYPPTHCWGFTQLQDPSPQIRADALRFIEEAQAAAEMHGVERRAIQLQVLRSRALDSLNRRDEAIVVLESTLKRSAKLGFVRSFVDGGEEVRMLLQAVADKRPDDGYVAMLLEAFGASDRPPRRRAEGATSSSSFSSADRTPPDLTNRELDVLELLQRRMTNKEIAVQLGIAPATVQMHTIAVYRKLGVRGRRQAVTAAIQIGILDG